MTGRVLMWAGGAVAAGAVVGSAVYWGLVGFRAGDVLGWLGVAVGVAGLVLAVYGAAADRRNKPDSSSGSSGGRVAASGERSVAVGGDNSGIVWTGDAGRDQIVNDGGQVFQVSGDQNVIASGGGASAYGSVGGDVHHHDDGGSPNTSARTDEDDTR